MLPVELESSWSMECRRRTEAEPLSQTVSSTLALMASLTHIPVCLSGTTRHRVAVTRRDATGPGIGPVSAFWSSSGRLLIFFVFSLTFGAKGRKLIEGLISTHTPTRPAKDSRLVERRQRGVWLINSSLEDESPQRAKSLHAIYAVCTNYGLRWRWRLSIREAANCQLKCLLLHLHLLATFYEYCGSVVGSHLMCFAY